MADKIKADLKRYARNQQTFGLFSPVFMGTGDPYQDRKEPVHSRHRGAQFTTNRKPISSKFLRLYEGEKQTSLFEVERQRAAETKKKNLTPEGFKPPSTPKKDLAKPLFGPHFPYMPESTPREKGVKAKIEPQPRPFTTTPAKKGWGNTPGITFGPPAPKEDPKRPMKGKEYTHSGGKYDEATIAEKEARRKHHELLAGRAPMKPVGRSIDYFDNINVQVVAASSVFKEDKVTGPLYRTPPKEEKRPATPFYPPKGPKSGPLGTCQKFPEWMPDPDTHRIALHKKELAVALASSVPFVPPSTPKSMPVKSVLFHTPGMAP